MKGADESMDFGASDRMRGRVPLGLHVNLVQAKQVLPDDATQAVTAGSAQVLSRPGRTPVSMAVNTFRTSRSRNAGSRTRTRSRTSAATALLAPATDGLPDCPRPSAPVIAAMISAGGG